jgi:hypothetical protein
VPDTKEQSKSVLQVADRCDRCTAQAFILARGIKGELMFCGHHYNKSKNSIDSWAFEIINEIQSIN